MKPIKQLLPVMPLVLTLLLTCPGCKLFELFKSDKKTIKRQVDRIKAALNRNDWKAIDSILADEFVWITSNGMTIKNVKRQRKVAKYGSKYFRESLDNLPANRISFFMKVRDLKKVTDQKYFSTVESRLKIRTGSADTDNLMWESHYTWIKAGDDWLVEEVKDLSDKKGTGGITYDTNPKPTKKKK